MAALSSTARRPVLCRAGAAFFAARAALAFGYRVDVLTHERSDIDVVGALSGADVVTSGSSTITFTNRYTPAGRVQYFEGTAQLFNLAACLATGTRQWRVLRAPVFHEVPGEIGDASSGAVRRHRTPGMDAACRRQQSCLAHAVVAA